MLAGALIKIVNNAAAKANDHCDLKKEATSLLKHTDAFSNSAHQITTVFDAISAFNANNGKNRKS